MRNLSDSMIPTRIPTEVSPHVRAYDVHTAIVYNTNMLLVMCLTVTLCQ